MFNQSWELVNKYSVPELTPVDVFIASPFSAVSKWRSTSLDNAIKASCRIAAVSDCTTAEYFFRGMQNLGKLSTYLRGKIDRLRSGRIALTEERLLGGYNHVLMQTATDRDLMQTLVSDEVARRVSLVPNGIRRDLFDIKPDVVSKTAVFIAELSGEYAAGAMWLVSIVWPKVIEQNSNARLLLVGRGASPSLKAAIKGASGVEHVEFVDDLRSVYENASTAICPVFKGYGLINKALEAMASGLPVVGGSAAFNGISGFEEGVHGIVCRPWHTEDFAAAINEMNIDWNLRIKIGGNARSLVAGEFRWESSIGTIERLINETLCKGRQGYK
jgi:glycosyltransferase involved in cell wall biosynthesis